MSSCPFQEDAALGLYMHPALHDLLMGLVMPKKPGACLGPGREAAIAGCMQ